MPTLQRTILQVTDALYNGPQRGPSIQERLENLKEPYLGKV